MAKLEDFLTKGQIGEIHLGMRPEQVESQWGSASDRSVQRRPVEIAKHGAVELAFGVLPGTNDSRLISGSIYFFNPKRKLPAGLVFEDWFPTQSTSEADFRRFLESIKLTADSRVDGENTNLLLETGASVVFVEGRLHSIHYRRRDSGAARRQLSVSIPETSLTQLRERALRENVPLNELIERILLANA
jgi:hypothetical protein